MSRVSSMATRTSSPTRSRSRSTSKGRGSGSSKRASTSSRSRSTAKKRPTSKRSTASRRPAPRAVRNGPGPVSRAFGALARAIAAIWLGIAHGVGAVVRGIVGGAKEIEPEQRRDGIGLLLCGLALVIAAGVWFEVPGGVMEFVRTVVAGTVGKVGWLVPFLVLLAAWRVMRDPVSNGPVGRQVIGWAAFSFGLHGIVHIANGSPEPASGDTTPLREGGGAVGYVVSALLLDLLRSTAVVVPLLLLLVFFGLLVITATPLYRVPDRLREMGDSLLGRRPATDDSGEPTQPIRLKRGSGGMGDTLDPLMGDPA